MAGVAEMSDMWATALALQAGVIALLVVLLAGLRRRIRALAAVLDVDEGAVSTASTVALGSRLDLGRLGLGREQAGRPALVVCRVHASGGHSELESHVAAAARHHAPGDVLAIVALPATSPADSLPEGLIAIDLDRVALSRPLLEPLALALSRDGTVVAAGHPRSFTDAMEMAVVATGAHATDRVLDHAWGRAFPVESAAALAHDDELGDTLRAIRRIAADDELLQKLAFVDGVVTIRVSDVEDIAFDLRGEGLRDGRRADAMIEIAPDLVRPMCLGELHEPAALLSGDLSLSGDLGVLLRFLPAVPRLSRRLRVLVNDPSANRPRFAVLSKYQLQPELLPTGLLTGTLSAQEPADRRLAAVLVLLGLHPVCRELEIAQTLDRVAVGRIAQVDCVGAMEAVAAMAASGSHRLLRDACRDIEPVPS